VNECQTEPDRYAGKPRSLPWMWWL
jgi:hypothetical protein